MPGLPEYFDSQEYTATIQSVRIKLKSCLPWGQKVHSRQKWQQAFK
jgi:hypothetical protein